MRSHLRISEIGEGTQVKSKWEALLCYSRPRNRGVLQHLCIQQSGDRIGATIHQKSDALLCTDYTIVLQTPVVLLKCLFVGLSALKLNLLKILIRSTTMDRMNIQSIPIRQLYYGVAASILHPDLIPTFLFLVPLETLSQFLDNLGSGHREMKSLEIRSRNPTNLRDNYVHHRRMLLTHSDF